MFDEREASQPHEWTHEFEPHSTNRKTSAATAQRWLTAGPAAADVERDLGHALFGTKDTEAHESIMRSAAGRRGWQPLPLSKSQMEELWERDEPVPTRSADLYGKERRKLVLQFDKYEWEFEPDTEKEGGGGWEEEARPAKRARESMRQEREQVAAPTTRSPPAFDSGMFSLHATAPSELYLQQLGPTPLELQLRHEWDHWERRQTREMMQAQRPSQGPADRKMATASAQRWLTAGPIAADSSETDRRESATEVPIVRSGVGWQQPARSKAELEELWERDEPLPTRSSDLYGKERRQLVLRFDKYEWEFERDAEKAGDMGWGGSDFFERPGVRGEPSSRDHRAMLIQQRKH